MYNPIKALGQNFLVDRTHIDTMVNALEMKGGDTVIEIGPGLGAITEELVARTRETGVDIIAVEIDKRFQLKLNSMYIDEPHIDVIEANILDWLPEYRNESDFKIIGSLPYYITSPIIHSIIKMFNLPSLCVLLIQKEVAEKIVAKAPESSYMSAFVQTFFDVEYIDTVSRKVFRPEPKVDAGVIKLTRKDKYYSPDFIRKYEGFLHKGFSNPRKMLNKPFSKEELEKGGISSNLRPQNLSAEDWLNFYNVLYS